MTAVLGISAYYHDSAAALVINGEIIAAAQEERFSRVKHDSEFPSRAIEYCLSEAKLRPSDLTCVVFYDKPWLKFERLIETYFGFTPKGFRSFSKMAPLWIKKKLWLESLIREEMSDYQGEVLFPEHHLSHGASAFFPSPFDEAAVLTMDGVGEWSTTSWGVGSGNSLELREEIPFPHSLGLLYSAFTYYCGFKVNSGEYKLMGLAPYGKPLYTELIKDNLVKIFDDGSFWLNQKYFSYCHGLRMTNRAFDRLFGAPARKPETTITQREMDIAASIQQVTEEIVLKLARNVREKSGQENLVLAGGVALNCVANGKLLREKIFEKIWVQPSSGDAGGSLGAAYLGYHHHLKQPRIALRGRDRQKGSFLGPKYDASAFLKAKGYPHHTCREEVYKRTAAELEKGAVVGWFQGRMEFGPRALGGRSIIGDARNPKMQKTLNLKIKYRESFRPFAPIVLEERASEFFDIESESPYMLMVAPVREERRNPEVNSEAFGIELLNQQRSDIPAVTHVDYSARIQTVDSERNPVTYKLLKAFEDLTGCPVLVNTSFNVRSEPIVCTPEDAYRCFMRTEMDVLVLDDIILYKSEQPAFEDEDNWRYKFALD